MKKCEGCRVKLIHLATEVTKTFAPDYYREIKQMTSIITEGVFESDDDRIEVKKNIGRKSYVVRFPYDKTKEVFYGQPHLKNGDL